MNHYQWHTENLSTVSASRNLRADVQKSSLINSTLQLSGIYYMQGNSLELEFAFFQLNLNPSGKLKVLIRYFDNEFSTLSPSSPKAMADLFLSGQSCILGRERCNFILFILSSLTYGHFVRSCRLKSFDDGQLCRHPAHILLCHMHEIG